MTGLLSQWGWVQRAGVCLLAWVLVWLSGLAGPPGQAWAAGLPATTIETIEALVEANPPGIPPGTATGPARAGLTAPGSTAPAPDPALSHRLQSDYGRLPMHFEPNMGQTAEEVRYLARGAGYSLFLTDTEAVMVLRKPTAPAASHPEAGPAVAQGSLDGTQRNPGPTGTPANPDSSVSWGDLPWPGFWHTGPTDGELPFSFQDPNTPFSFQRSSTSFSFQRSSVGMLSWPLQRPEAPRDAGASRLAPTPERGSQSESETAVVRMRLTGATRNPAPAIAGLERQPGISN